MSNIATIREYTCHLENGTVEVRLRSPLMHQDALADTFRVAVLHGKDPVDLSGMTVRGYFFDTSTKQTLILDGAIEGHHASVTLSAECYDSPRHASLVVQVCDGDVRHTVLKADFCIDRTGSEDLYFPSDSQSLESLMKRIEALEKGGGTGGSATPGEAGGHYTPSVTQPNTTTMRVAFTPSKSGMPSVPAVNITLPQGPKGDKGDGANLTADSIRNALDYTPADASAVFALAAEPQFDNFFDENEIEYGKLLGSDGTVSDTSAALAVTGFIPIKAGDVIRMENFGLYPSGSCRIVVYNTSYNFVVLVQSDALPAANYYLQAEKQDEKGNWVEFTVVRPSAGGFIRICTNTAAIGNNPVLTINQEIVYEEAYGSKLNPRVKVDYSQIVNSPQKNGWSILPYEHLNICYSGINRKPINTVEHFTDAAENFGYNVLKCDVRPTSDGELVCCHDAGFTFDGNGYITTYDSSNQTKIHDVTAATVLGYSFRTGEHPCLVGDYLDVCRKYGKVAFVTIRNEYMDVVIPKLLEELRVHNMTYSTIINCMTYESLVQWRQQDSSVMINYTLNFGVAIDQMQIDRAIGLGYCSLCGFGLNSSLMEPNHTCDFEYARDNGVRLLQAIAYKEGSPEACYALGYDGCQIGIPWGTPDGGVSEDYVQTMINSAIGAAIGGAY